MNDRLEPRLRILLGSAIAIGPGKAALLEAIGDTGSIAAAGRRMGMSYRHAWLLAKTMNACFRGPLVEATKGGVGGGGAHLTKRLTENELSYFSQLWHDGCSEAIIEAQDVDRNHSTEV